MQKHPIPVVRVILEDPEGKILLLKRANTTYGKNQWCLPGGKIDYNQTIHSACKREVKEETSLDISDLEFILYQDNLSPEPGIMHCINLYFSAKHTGTLALNHESSDAKWVYFFNVINYDIAFKNDEAITKYFSKR